MKYQLRIFRLPDGREECGHFIGCLPYPEYVDPTNDYSKLRSTYGDGIWLLDSQSRVQYVAKTFQKLTDGIDYGGVIFDTVAPFDRAENLIKIGDSVYFASRNIVHRGTVKKINDVSTYGTSAFRKVLVTPDEGGKSILVGDSRYLMKV